MNFIVHLPRRPLQNPLEISRLWPYRIARGSDETGRKADQNTVMCTWRGNPSVLEVTPAKRIVWMLPKNVLGNSSSIQLLDEPGAMEDGDLQR